MPYVPTSWVNLVTTLGPTNLNHLELGLQTADANASSALTNAAAAQATANAAIPKSIVTTAGDIIYATGSAVVTRLAVGAAGTVLHGGASAPSWSALQLSEISGYPADSTKFARGDGTWAVPPATAGLKTGDLVWSVATSRTGAVLADGSTYDGTNATFTALWVALGSVLPQNAFVVPDLRERVAVGHGPATALLANDGVAVANRHATRHRHTLHTHAMAADSGTGSSASTWKASNPAGPVNIGSADGGSGVSTDPLDGPGYVALNPFLIL